MVKQIVFFIFIILIIRSYADNEMPHPSILQQVRSKTINICADLLYWHTGETVDWAFTLANNSNTFQTSYKTFDFDLDFGFRVGLGFNFKNDWDAQVSYTSFEPTATDYTNGSVTPAFLGARLSLLEPFSTGKASLKIKYKILDGDLGCTFLVSKYFNIRPAIGIKGGWIYQYLDSNWTIPNFLEIIFLSACENLKQLFQGCGPKAKIISKWYFANFQKQNLSLIGMFELGYLWGHWSIKDKYLDSFLTVIDVKTTERNFGSFVFHGFVGLGWECYFHHSDHFETKIGYEIEDWLNQFQIYSDASGSQNNDLILQGLTFNLRVDY